MKFESYLSGFVDGEGCFSISFNFRQRLKLGIEVRPSFSISQNKKSLSVLKEIHEFFECGAIRFSRHDQTYKFEIRSITDLVKKVIPHFRKYPLRTTKADDFEKFDRICQLVSANQHRNAEQLEKIIKIAAEMNPSGKRRHPPEKLLSVLGKVKR